MPLLYQMAIRYRSCCNGLAERYFFIEGVMVQQILKHFASNWVFSVSMDGSR